MPGLGSDKCDVAPQRPDISRQLSNQPHRVKWLIYSRLGLSPSEPNGTIWPAPGGSQALGEAKGFKTKGGPVRGVVEAKMAHGLCVDGVRVDHRDQFF
jgi:hypothetical protein